MSALLAILGVGRVLLALSPLPGYIQDHHLLSTPLTAYPRLQECLYLYDHGVDPYSGSLCHHSPLYISLFTTIIPSGRIPALLLWTAVDIIAAWALVHVWRARQGFGPGWQGNASINGREALIAAAYVLNPYLVLPSLALSTSTLENALHVLAVMFAARGRPYRALFCMALLSSLALPNLLLLPPLLMLLLSESPSSRLAAPRPMQWGNKDWQRLAAFTSEFALYTLVLAGVATFMIGTGWIHRVWGATMLLPDLTPNVGFWWYFFTEMFDYFRPFYLMVFSMHMVIYVAPICIKFQHDPLYAFFILTGVLALFKPYPTLSDSGLFLTMIALFPEVYPYFRTPIVTALLHLHSALLLPLFHSLWLVQGTGNANFFYASTLVFGVSNGFALADAVWAGLRIAVGRLGDGKTVVQE